jgi:hypothetical protein
MLCAGCRVHGGEAAGRGFTMPRLGAPPVISRCSIQDQDADDPLIVPGIARRG